MKITLQSKPIELVSPEFDPSDFLSDILVGVIFVVFCFLFAVFLLSQFKQKILQSKQKCPLERHTIPLCP